MGKTINRIEKTFKELKSQKKKAFVAFVTAGDPTIKATVKIVHEMVAGGANIIELGIPFSDPMADGVVIQKSSERALKKGATLKGVLSCLKEIRKTSEVPVVLFGYYNPIFKYGVEKFARDAARAGADGVLVVDLPPEEDEELNKHLRPKGVELIHLVTPTSDSARMKYVSKGGKGFLYYVSVAGVTGARKSVSGSLKKAVDKLKKITDTPVVVGFGVSTPEQAKSVSKISDGVVVGSAIVKVIEKNNKSKEVHKKAGKFVSSLTKAM